MTRTFPLAVFAAVPLAATFLAGCAFNDCSFDFDTAEGFRSAQAEVAPSDTLTVLFEATESVEVVELWLRLGAETPRGTSGATALISAEVEVGGFGVREVPFLRAEGRGDTLVVPLSTDALALADARCAGEAGEGPAAGQRTTNGQASGAAGGAVVRAVCSPPVPYYRLFVDGASAPPGTRHVRYAVRDAWGGERALRPGGSVASGARGTAGPRAVRG